MRFVLAASHQTHRSKTSAHSTPTPEMTAFSPISYCSFTKYSRTPYTKTHAHASVARILMKMSRLIYFFECHLQALKRPTANTISATVRNAILMKEGGMWGVYTGCRINRGSSGRCPSCARKSCCFSDIKGWCGYIGNVRIKLLALSAGTECSGCWYLRTKDLSNMPAQYYLLTVIHHGDVFMTNTQ